MDAGFLAKARSVIDLMEARVLLTNGLIGLSSMRTITVSSKSNAA